MKALSPKVLRYLTEVDHHGDEALGRGICG
jgi:hypothetical protein